MVYRGESSSAEESSVAGAAAAAAAAAEGGGTASPGARMPGSSGEACPLSLRERRLLRSRAFARAERQLRWVPSKQSSVCTFLHV